jgi:putative transposase
MKVEILSGVVAQDHVHLLVSYPPQVSISRLIQKLKGKSSYKLQIEFASLRKAYWGQRMGAARETSVIK